MTIALAEMKKVKFPNIKASELEYIFLRIQDVNGTVDSVTPEDDGEFTVIATIPTDPSSETQKAMAGG